ncbi:hypothetical protein MKX08_005923 [Trichoderma sp. CBMAI-0020]|nr:hypothetical protein MKX08_005923 [Trichoderma sp. CBMAI-0020]
MKSAPLGTSAEIDSGSYFDEVMFIIGLGAGATWSMETGWWHAEGSGQDSAVDWHDGSGSRVQTPFLVDTSRLRIDMTALDRA